MIVDTAGVTPTITSKSVEDVPRKTKNQEIVKKPKSKKAKLAEAAAICQKMTSWISVKSKETKPEVEIMEFKEMEDPEATKTVSEVMDAMMEHVLQRGMVGDIVRELEVDKEVKRLTLRYLKEDNRKNIKEEQRLRRMKRQRELQEVWRMKRVEKARKHEELTDTFNLMFLFDHMEEDEDPVYLVEDMEITEREEPATIMDVVDEEAEELRLDRLERKNMIQEKWRMKRMVRGIVWELMDRVVDKLRSKENIQEAYESLSDGLGLIFLFDMEKVFDIDSRMDTDEICSFCSQNAIQNTFMDTGQAKNGQTNKQTNASNIAQVDYCDGAGAGTTGGSVGGQPDEHHVGGGDQPSEQVTEQNWQLRLSASPPTTNNDKDNNLLIMERAKHLFGRWQHEGAGHGDDGQDKGRAE